MFDAKGNSGNGLGAALMKRKSAIPPIRRKRVKKRGILDLPGNSAKKKRSPAPNPKRAPRESERRTPPARMAEVAVKRRRRNPLFAKAKEKAMRVSERRYMPRKIELPRVPGGRGYCTKASENQPCC